MKHLLFLILTSLIALVALPLQADETPDSINQRTAHERSEAAPKKEIIEVIDGPRLFDVEVDGLHYVSWTPGEAAVVSSRFDNPENPVYSGDIVIPEKITVEGYDYIVTEIYEEAFAKSDITSASIPGTVRALQSYAFASCQSLISVTMAEGTERIHDYAFSNCDALESIEIPASVSFIAPYAFSDCQRLTTINVNPASTYFATVDGVLLDKDLTTILCCPNGKAGAYISPESVTTLEAGAFVGSSYLTSITLPDAIKAIPTHEFQGCSALESFNVPASVTFIGDYAFADCSALTSITIPEGIENIGSYVFENCDMLPVVDGVRYAGCIAVDAANREMTSCSLLPGTRFIDSYAFQDCKSLTSVTLPEGLLVINGGAFSGCSALKDVVLPESLTTLKGWSFYGCSSLKSIIIPRKVRSIGNAFQGCTALESAVLPEGLIAFDGFNGCSSLANVNIPSTVKTIMPYALNRTAIRLIELPEGLEKIYYGAFADCRNLTSIVIPAGLETIEYDTFRNCSSLKSLVVEEGHLHSIDGGAFRGCSSLKEVKLPKSLKSIGNLTFGSCTSLTEFTIPSSVNWMGSQPFGGCSNLKTIYCRPETPPSAQWLLGDYGATAKMTLYVPKGTLEAYKAADRWKEFGKIEEKVFPDTGNTDTDNTDNGNAVIWREGSTWEYYDESGHLAETYELKEPVVMGSMSYMPLVKNGTETIGYIRTLRGDSIVYARGFDDKGKLLSEVVLYDFTKSYEEGDIMHLGTISNKAYGILGSDDIRIEATDDAPLTFFYDVLEDGDCIPQWNGFIYKFGCIEGPMAYFYNQVSDKKPSAKNLSHLIFGNKKRRGAPTKFFPFGNAYNIFAFDFFEQLCETSDAEEAGGNVVASPLSAQFALSMLQNGAAGNTLREMQFALGTSAYTVDEVNAYNRSLIDKLQQPVVLSKERRDELEALNEEAEEYNKYHEGSSIKPANIDDLMPKMEVANGIWTAPWLPVYEDFFATNAANYDAAAETADFSQQSTMDAIDSWVSDKTHGTISSINEKPDEEIAMMLINTIFFRGSWDDIFYANGEKPFTNADGSRVLVPTMNNDDDKERAETENFKMVRATYAPYWDNYEVGRDQVKYRMGLYLPKHDNAVLTTAEWQRLGADAVKGRTSLTMPRFSVSQELNLNDVLKSMGMQDAFNERQANFSALSPQPTFVSKAKQLCSITVDERGTTAAAASVIIDFPCGIDTRVLFEMKIDRPFYFTIETSDGDILFIGRVSHLDGPLDPNGIVSAPASSLSAQAYDLSGRRVYPELGRRAASSRPGVYIVGGKKVVK